MNDIAASLVEGDYYLGLGSLVNSLIKGGFSGSIVVGVRSHEEWVDSFNDDLTKHNVNCRIETRILDTNWHPANYKAHFLRDLADERQPDRLTYWDPDNTLIGSYDFIRRWLDHGVGMVEDSCYASFPANHPIRREWEVAFSHINVEISKKLNRYYNSGFVGVNKLNQKFWNDWAVCVDIIGRYINLKDFKPGRREEPFYGTDQDALNMAAMITKAPLSTIGPDGMGFLPAGYVMLHAADSPKPWRKSFVKHALGGRPPSQGDRSWLAHSDGPIAVLPERVRLRKQQEIRIAAAIGRFARRSTI